MISEKAQIYVDRNIFYNIMDNVVVNSLRYAKTYINITMCLEGNYLKLSVQDDGPGFSDYILKQGMEPFVGESNDSNGHYGMGLYICRLLCEKHGGFLRISNREGRALNEIYIKIAGLE